MEPAQAQKKRILVVDDDPMMHALLVDALGEHYDVHAVSSGAEALDTLAAPEAARPDLVLCDVLMPQMDGFECLERMTDRVPGLRVVMMTGETSPQTVLTSLRKRAYDFLAKPFTLGQVRGLVAEALEYEGPEEFHVVSATPQWVEIEAPCSLASARRLFRFLAQLKTGLPLQTQTEVASAFRELLQNAVEHGGKSDPTRSVHICYLRLERVIVYSIRDPGEGFRLEEIEHAAVANPPDEPERHVQRRQQMNLRPGGFGLFIASQFVDELVYNQKRNEVVFVKYLPKAPE